MNTTAAATQAGVTVATIRTWCRTGVITATKAAGKWVIDQVSLAARIAIGQLKRKAHNMIDLTATYTFTRAGDTQPTTITPKIRDRQRDGERIITVRGLAPLLADQINAIHDELDRAHTLEVLHGAVIAIRDQPADFDSMIATRDEGRLTTTYAGTRHLPVETVLDLAERLRTQLQH